MYRTFSRNLILLGLALVVLCGGLPGGSAPPRAAAASSRAEDGFTPGEVNVRLKQASDLAGVAAQFNLDPRPVEQFGSRPIFRLRILDGASPQAKADALMDDSARVEVAEPNYNAGPPEGSGNSWSIGGSAGEYVAQWAPARMNLAAAHRVSRGAGVIVAVLDTGVDRRHPALAGRLLAGYDFVNDDNDPSEEGDTTLGPYGHGTHVAGLVALAAPEAKILPVRVLDRRGVGNMWVLAEAVRYALDPDGDPSSDDGADVINLSLATAQRSRILQEIIGDACGDDDPEHDTPTAAPTPGVANRDVMVVAAAGNDGAGANEEMYPAAESGVEGLLAVGASTQDDTLASFSQHESWVRVVAPGTGILSSVPGGNNFATWQGTSMAAPLVAGTAAIMRSAVPELHPDAIDEHIREFSRRIEADDVDRRVDAAAAMQGMIRSWAPGVGGNPVDSTSFFVRQHYLDFLNRAPDAGGLRFWTGNVASCGTDAQCAEVRRVDTSAAFFLSIEFQQTGFLVYRMNVASTGQMPRYEKFMPDTQAIGEGVVVGAAGWPERLEQNKRAFARAWVSRPEFTNAFPATLSPAAFVSQLFQNAGVVPTDAERDALVAELAASNNAEGRASVLRKVAEHPSLALKEKNRAFVLMQYFGYLRRDPDEGQDTNMDGFLHWLGKLEESGGDYTRAEMVKAFLSSIEYRQRFRQ